MNNFDNIQKGSRVWKANYSHARHGVRCTYNLEPIELEVVEIINKDYCRVKRVKVAKGKTNYTTTEYIYNIFETREKAVEYYKTRLSAHVKRLIDTIANYSSIGALHKRLQTYELKSLSEDILKIEKLAESIIQKLDNNA